MTGEEASLIDFRFLAADADLPANRSSSAFSATCPTPRSMPRRVGLSPDETQG